MIIHTSYDFTTRIRSLQDGNVFSNVCLLPGGGEDIMIARKQSLRRLCFHTGFHTPTGRHTPHPPEDTPRAANSPPPRVHAGIWSTSGRYTSHWNAFFLHCMIVHMGSPSHMDLFKLVHLPLPPIYWQAEFTGNSCLIQHCFFTIILQ